MSAASSWFAPASAVLGFAERIHYEVSGPGMLDRDWIAYDPKGP